MLNQKIDSQVIDALKFSVNKIQFQITCEFEEITMEIFCCSRTHQAKR